MPYLHELTENPNYQVKAIIPEDFQVVDPNNNHATRHRIFYDNEQQLLIVGGKKELAGSDKHKIKVIKINTDGTITSKTNSLGHILNNGTILGYRGYSHWILNSHTTVKKYKPLLTEEEKEDIEKWLPKFKEAYNKASYVYLPVSVKDYHMLIDGEWYFVESGIQNKPEGFTKKFPVKEPEGRMIALEDVTPDFFTDPSERDTFLIKVLGYGQEYFGEGQGANPINGSAGHYYLQLNMREDTLRFKHFGTMGPQLSVYKIPEDLGGHEDVVLIVQTRNAMLPHREFGGMYVVRPKWMGK